VEISAGPWGWRRVRRTGRAAADSGAVAVAARAGLAARGVIYVLVGLLAIRIAFGDSGQQADRGGAVEQLASQPFGGVLVWALGLGLAGMAVWRLSEALFGAARPDGAKMSTRLASAVRCVFYAVVASSVISFALGRGGESGGSGDRASRDVTARALDLPLGRWLVGAAGLALVAAGIWIAVRALRRTFRKHLTGEALTRRARRVVEFLGAVGGACRGVVFAAAGGFVLTAAVRYDPGQARGLDDTLRTFRDTPAGPWLLVATAAGLALFGVFSFAMARWRRV
jgi:hypothetical protein